MVCTLTPCTNHSILYEGISSTKLPWIQVEFILGVRAKSSTKKKERYLAKHGLPIVYCGKTLKMSLADCLQICRILDVFGHCISAWKFKGIVYYSWTQSYASPEEPTSPTTDLNSEYSSDLQWTFTWTVSCIGLSIYTVPCTFINALSSTEFKPKF